MDINKKSAAQEIGQRLRIVRTQLNYSPKEMAGRLGINPNGYYKNENGENFPGIGPLYRLQNDFSISMDWLMFNKGPMYYEEKVPEKPAQAEEEKKPPGLEDTLPEVRELLDHMAEDPLLRYEVLIYFYKYKENKSKEAEQ